MVGRPVREGLRGRAFVVLKKTIFDREPFPLELGSFTEWRLVNTRESRKLRLAQVDLHNGVLWLVARVKADLVVHVEMIVDRGNEQEGRYILALTCIKEKHGGPHS